MQQDKTEDRYSRETLLPMNMSADKLRQFVFKDKLTELIGTHIHRQQCFAAVPIFGFILLHIADNKNAATFRPQRRLNDLFIKV